MYDKTLSIIWGLVGRICSTCGADKQLERDSDFRFWRVSCPNGLLHGIRQISDMELAQEELDHWRTVEVGHIEEV